MLQCPVLLLGRRKPFWSLIMTCFPPPSHLLPRRVGCYQWLITLKFHNYMSECRAIFIHLFGWAHGGLFHSDNIHLLLLGKYSWSLSLIIPSLHFLFFRFLEPYYLDLGTAGLVLCCCCLMFSESLGFGFFVFILFLVVFVVLFVCLLYFSRDFSAPS